MQSVKFLLGCSDKLKIETSCTAHCHLELNRQRLTSFKNQLNIRKLVSPDLLAKHMKSILSITIFNRFLYSVNDTSGHFEMCVEQDFGSNCEDHI